MRKKPCPSMMQPTNFADFNPLDVLAAAASLQRRTEENVDDSEHDNKKTGSGASVEEEEDAQEGGEDDDGGAGDKGVNCEVTAPIVSDPKQQNGAQENQDGMVDGVFLRPAQKCDSDSTVRESAPVANGRSGAASPEVVVRGRGIMATPAPPPPLLSTEKRRTFDAGASPRTMLGAVTRVGTGSGPAPASCRQQMMDHSYAFVSQLQSLKAEEDEGYSSRSSLDDDSEETVSRLNLRNGQSLIGCSARTGNGLSVRSVRVAPNVAATSDSQQQQQHVSQQQQQSQAQQQTNHASLVSTDPSGKPTKIVIVSKDSKLQRIISGINLGGEGSQPLAPTGSRGSSAMLRTLLGQKAGLKTNTTPLGHSKVIIAGGLSGRVINVLKSGGVSLAPNEGFRQDTLLQSEGTSPLAEGKTLLMANETVPADDDNNAFSQETTTTKNMTTPEDHVIVDDNVADTVTENGNMAETGDGLTSPIDHDQSLVEHPADSSCVNTSLISASQESETTNDDQPTEPCAEEAVVEKQLSITVSVEDSSRHGSEVVTEDETSCDSSKCDITVDTTPVMSPSGDTSSPMMSPVCERDVAIMSPMVGSPEVLCDLFKLPTAIKHHIRTSETSLVVTEEQCKDITVSGAVSFEAGDVCVDPTAVSDVPSDISTDVSEEPTPPEELNPEVSSSVSSSQGGLVEGAQPEGALTLTDSGRPELTQQEGDLQQQTETHDTVEHTEEKRPVESDDTDELGAGTSQHEDVPAGEGSSAQNMENSTEGQEQSETRPESEPTQEGEDVSDTIEPVLDVLESHKSVTPDPAVSGARNQYIIEDDESPVAKFGTPRTSTDEDAASSDCSSPMALAITPTVTTTQSTQPPLTQSETARDVKSPVKSTTTGLFEASGNEPVKLILTADASPKSVFSAVRRPLVTGVKAIPGSLHMVPVVPSAKPGSSIMHVLPVSGARGLVTQLIPKTAGQFVTGVPVLSGKTVVLPDNGKGRMSTLLVPVSVATATPKATGAISLVQTSKVKLGNLQKRGEKVETTHQVVTDTEATTPPPKLQRRELSSPLVFHGRITPISTTSDTMSEPLSSPENSHQGGFSGVIMGGRQTPDTLESLRSSRKSLENSKDKISIKISSNNVVESDDSMSSEPGFSKKESIGIGMMGSLSWKSIESPAARGLTPIGTGGSGGREFVRIQGGEVRTGLQASDEDSMPPLEKPKKRPGRVGKRANSKAAHPYTRKKSKLSTANTIAPPPPLPATDQYVPQVVQLHPLIDHDYCMFTEFNAQIQSSIIATTESKTKIEKKYAKKTKAVRTKAVRGFITEESLKVSKVAMEKVINKGRRGRLKKRRASKEKVTTDEELSLDGTEELEEGPLTPSEEKPKRVVEQKPSRTSERRAKLQALKDDKNYVKITGSYQDEFVYFATKNKRNRPRKSLEDANSQLTKQPQVGGMTVFDWYKDLSKADKTSRFGTPTTSGPSSPVPTFGSPPVEPIEIKPIVTVVSEGASVITSTSAAGNLTTSSSYRPGATPIHESEVADLVCDLSEINSLTTNEVTVAHDNDMDLSSFIIGGQDIKTEPASSRPAVTGNDPALPAPADIPPVSVDKMAEMAEQVRDMLNSMGVDELEKLELKFGDVDTAATGMTDTSFDGLLGGFTSEQTVPMTSQAATGNLCDLDEINDSDLLQSDLGILAPSSSTTSASSTTPAHTLKPSASAPSLLLDAHGERLPVADHNAFGFSKTLEFADVKLDKTELFPDMAPPPPPPSDVSTLAANTAPELTLVSMYWNDLPGLVLMGQQYVRLVDIHKQVLPAKDTGILKKRCQMMGLPIANCSELQRDFLVRYANAAKSKSTVIVSKEAAQTLIGFYVEPKSRPSRQSMEERGIALAEQARAQAAAARQRAQATAAVPPSDKPAPASATPKTKWTVGSPVPPPTPIDGKSRGSGKGSSSVPRKRRLTGGSVSDGSPVPASPGVSPGNSDVKRSARLRHKKVCYADMLLGNHYETQDRQEKEDVGATSVPAETVPNGGPGVVVVTSIQEKKHVVSDANLENKETERLMYPEDIEIRKLKIKMRRKSLNAKEKRRLRRLREKVRKRDLKHKLRERRKLERLNGQKKKSVVAAAMATIAKTKKKLQETHMFNKKYNQEHCYAAAPESPDKKDLPKHTDSNTTDDHKDPRVTDCDSAVVSNTPGESDVEVIVPVDSADEGSDKVVVVVVDENKEEEEIKIEAVPTDATAKRPSVERKADPTPAGPPVRKQSLPPKKTLVKRPPVAVLHRDAAQRGPRGRFQNGQLHLHLCTDRHAACISCATCGEYYSVKRFMKHMHHQNKRDELASVTLTQTLVLRAADAASAEERATWAEFQAFQAQLQGPPPPPRRVKLTSPTVKITAGVTKGKPAAINKTSTAVNKTSTTVNKTSPAVNRSSAMVNKTSPGVNKTSPGVSKTSVLVKRTLLMNKTSPGNSAGVMRTSSLVGKAAAGVLRTSPAVAKSTTTVSKDGAGDKKSPEVKGPLTNGVLSNGNIVANGAPHPTEHTPSARGRAVSASPSARGVVGNAKSRLVASPSAGRRPGAVTGAKARTVTAASPVSRSPPVLQTATPSPQPPRSNTPGSTRHSTRVRKQKQLHPIEKYVFSSASPAAASSEPPPKRARLASGPRDITTPASGRTREAVTPPSSAPVRKVRLRLSTGAAAATTKYDLRAPPDNVRQ